MRTRVIRRFLSIAFLLLAASLLTLDIFFTHEASQQRYESLRSQLSHEAHMLETTLPAADHFQSWVQDSAARVEARVTLLDRNGVTLADSSPDPETAADRVQAAIALEPSASPAATLRLEGVLKPSNNWVAALAISTLCMVLAALLGFIFLRLFGRQITRLRIYAEHLLDPEPGDQTLPTGNDDLGDLAESLRRTASGIRELVERLKIEGTRREAVLSSMVEGVLAIDQNLRVTFCNNSFARIVGARTPVNPGITLLELVRDPGLMDIVATVLASGERLERRLTLAGTESRSFEVLAGPFAASAMRGVLLILHDITALERLERVRKDFVANVSHELRTPLASIRGYAETLLDGALEDEKHNRRFVEIIMAQAIRLTNIASDLLTLSELESSAEAKAPQTFFIGAALEASVRAVEPTARERAIHLIYDGGEQLKVLGQQLRMEQVFINLLDNAVKFNRAHGEVRVETRVTGGKAVITIADTGIGIPSEDLPRVFERFYRVDKARSREMGGTGLGLSIVKHAIEQMGGSITVESKLGEGSRFTVAIPTA